MAVIFGLLLLVALAAAKPDYCKAPDEPPAEFATAADHCEHEEECMGKCFLEALDAIDEDGWVKANVIFDMVFPGSEYEASNDLFTTLTEQCVENGKEIEETFELNDCDKVNYVVGCVFLLLPDECGELADSVEEELEKRKRK